MTTRCSRVATALVLAILLSPVATPAAVQDHPVIKPLPEVVRKSGKFQKYGAHKFRVGEKKKYTEKEVKGKFWELHYHTKKGTSGLYILENYKAAALEKGGTIVYEDKARVVFTLPTSTGGTLWTEVNRNGWNNIYYLYIVEEKGFKKALTFGADEMKRQLDAKGRVAIYGINFDFNKATLKPGSEKVLLEMVKLLKSAPDLKIEIQGHTDNVGGKEYNLKLSKDRAGTVKQFLLLYGIEDGRLTTAGFGFDKPVASNDTEAGRAKNRRVELKKM
jgi:OOP family OmpA-OmpF porin